MGRYVALLRGINVGGKNLIKMPELRACFEKHGFSDVSTYIQSGNVLFSTKEPAGKLVKTLEEILGSSFGYEASVVLRSDKQLERIVEQAPKGFGTRPAQYRYDVMFLKRSLTGAAAIQRLSTKPGVDTAHAGKGVVYFSRLIQRASQSYLSKVVSSPIYKSMTIRNWNTTTKLLDLLKAKE